MESEPDDLAEVAAVVADPELLPLVLLLLGIPSLAHEEEDRHPA
jgi:hypothetical protein